MVSIKQLEGWKCVTHGQNVSYLSTSDKYKIDINNNCSDKISFRSWWMIFVLWILYVNSFIDRLVLVMLVDPIKADLGLSDVQMGILLGPAFAISYGLLGVPLGWALDKYPRRWVIYICVTAWSLAAASSGIARSFIALLLCRIGVGSGEAGLVPGSYALIGDAFPQRRATTAMAIFQTGSLVGTASAFAIGGLVIGFATSLGTVEFPVLGLLKPWQISLILIGIPPLFLAFLLFTFAEPGHPHKTSGANPNPSMTADAGIIEFCRDNSRILVSMILGFAMVVLLANSLVAWAPTYIVREFGWPANKYGPLLGAISLVAASATIFKGWIVDWMYTRGITDAHLRFYIWMLLIAAPTVLFSFIVTSPIAFIILYGISQTLLLNFMIFVASTVNMITPREFRGRIIALFVSIFTLLGVGLGPLITAMFTDYLFKDEGKLGHSLFLLSCITLPISLTMLHIARNALRRKLTEIPDGAPA